MKVTHALYTSFIGLFPPPKFLEMPTVGLDISDRKIRFVELKRHFTHWRLGKYGSEDIEPGVMEDGYINNMDKLVEALGKMKRAHNLRFVNISLPEEKSYVFNTSVPIMREADIRDALRFKIEENVPISLNDAVFDFRTIKEKPQPGDTKIAVSVTVVHTKVVESYLTMCKNAGLIPLSFQVESQAAVRAVVPRDAKETYLVIAIRETKTVFSIVSQGEIQFTSTIPVGGEAMVASLKKNLKIDENEVEQIRQGRETRESNDMFLSLVNAAGVLRDEVQKLFVYWESYGHEFSEYLPIEKIVLSGADSMFGLEDYLSRSLEKKVDVANPWINVLTPHEDVPPLTFREALDYAPALGLALTHD